MWLQNKFFREILCSITCMFVSLILLYPCALYFAFNFGTLNSNIKYEHLYLHMAPSLFLCFLLVASFLYFTILLLKCIVSRIKKTEK